MKQRLVFLQALIVTLVMLSCSNEKHLNNLSAIKGNQEFATFTTPHTDGKTVLTGVINLCSEQIIVPPAEYTTITADSNIITCTAADNMKEVYLTTGERLGQFEMITAWTHHGNYYLGVKYINKTYYFPDTKEIVATQNSYHEFDMLFLETKFGWDMRTMYGKRILRLPPTFTVLKDAKEQSFIRILVPNDEGKVQMYNTAGEKLKELSIRQVQKLTKTMEIQIELSPTVSIAKVANLTKL